MGAAIGAGSGALLGTAQGAGAAAYSGASVQQHYDVSYAQCMASRGNIVQEPVAEGGGYPAQYAYGGGYPAPPYPYAYPYGPYPYGPAFVGVGVGGWGCCWGPRLLVLIEADPEQIAGRRRSDTDRTREAALVDDIKFDLEWSRATAAASAMATGAPVKVIRNDTGTQKQAAQELFEVIRKLVGA
jgi:hypothetical protein